MLPDPLQAKAAQGGLVERLLAPFAGLLLAPDEILDNMKHVEHVLQPWHKWQVSQSSKIVWLCHADYL
jgi:hypothetical protein